MAAMALVCAPMPVDDRPVVVYDDDCGLCTRAVRWLAAHCDLAAVPGDDAGQAASVVVRTAGRTLTGGEAVATLLRASRSGLWRAVGQVLWLAPVRPLTSLAYRLVAANRRRISSALGWESCPIR